MSGTIPPIPPPFGTSSGNPGSPNVNKVDMMPTTTDSINTTTTTNVSQSVVDESLNFLIQEEGLMSQMFLLLTKRISRVGKLVSLQQLPFSPATKPVYPGRLVARDEYPGPHVARDKSNEKARRGYVPERLIRATTPGPHGFMQTIKCHCGGFSRATCRPG
ncbi:hypothetical protein Tco_0789082 [Tanacetum coccineum]